MNHVRPFLKWAGSKYNCLNHILSELPDANQLIEPFAGSGAVFINTQYPCYLIAEENNDLIRLFKHLQKEGESFIDYCEAYFTEANNEAEQYYLFRDEFNQTKSSKKRAAIFLYLNRHGYNGLCRYNKDGIFNVPFGRYIKPCFPRERMRFFQEKSRHVQFIRHDFRKTFALAKPGDLIYCDPPYAPIDQVSNFTSYTGKPFGEREQIILAELASTSAKRGITVVISNHDTEFTRHHYRESSITSFPVKRYISRNSDSRGPVQELLAVFKAS